MSMKIFVNFKAICIFLLLIISYASRADNNVSGIGQKQVKAGQFRYTLVMSKNDEVCKHMLIQYNEDLTKYGYERYDEHEEFDAIKWKTITYTYFVNGKERKSTSQVSKFDVNNDGKEETVIKDFSGDKWGYDLYSYYVFEQGAVDFTQGVASTQFSNTLGQLRSTRPYHLRALNSSAVAESGMLRPFIYKGVTYLSFRGLHEVQPVEWKKYLVIAKYKDHVPISAKNSVLQDICYFQRIRTQ